MNCAPVGAPILSHICQEALSKSEREVRVCCEAGVWLGLPMRGPRPGKALGQVAGVLGSADSRLNFGSASC